MNACLPEGFLLNERVSLLSYAERYQFCTRCGHPGLLARSHIEFQCPACEFKHFINPIAAVVAILESAAGELLLLRRARDPGRGKLGLPGGFVDPGESAEEALRREVREEIGMEVGHFAYFTSLPNRYVYQGIATPTLDVFFTGRVASFAEARIVAETEVEALITVPPRQVDFEAVAFPSNAKALRRYAAGRIGG